MSGNKITYDVVEESNYTLYDENDTYYNYNDENGDSVRDEMFEYVTEGVLLTSISVLGLIGNILAMYVLLRPSLRGIFSNILTGLASFDALFLATLPFTFGLPILSPYYRDHMFVHIMPVSYGLTLTFRLGSVLATLSVTLERFFAIVLPLKDVRRFKKWLIPGSIIITVIWNSPTFFEITTTVDGHDNSTYIITGTSLRKNFIYFSVYKIYCKIAIDLFAYVLMLVLNSFIIIKLVHSSRFRNKMTKNEGTRKKDTDYDETGAILEGHAAPRKSIPLLSKGETSLKLEIKHRKEMEEQRQEHKLGTLLVSISVLFICCQSFKMIPDIYELIFCPPVEGQDHECETTPFISTCVSMSHLLVCGNSALNWIIYLLAGEKFRRVWCQTYLPAKCRPQSLKRTQTEASRFTAQARTATAVFSNARTHTISNNKNRQESMELEALSSRLQEPEKAPPDLYLSSPNGHFIKVTTESTAL